MIDREKRSKTPSEVTPVEDISRNLQSFLEISSTQKEVLPSQTARPCTWVIECFQIKGRYTLTERFPESIESSKFVSEEECQESLIQGKIHMQQNWNKGLKYL